jgi:hypothetical protein
MTLLGGETKTDPSSLTAKGLFHMEWYAAHHTTDPKTHIASCRTLHKVQQKPDTQLDICSYVAVLQQK